MRIALLFIRVRIFDVAWRNAVHYLSNKARICFLYENPIAQTRIKQSGRNGISRSGSISIDGAAFPPLIYLFSARKRRDDERS